MKLIYLRTFLVGFASVAVADLPSIKAKGSKFLLPDGTQFFIKGVAYQQDSGAGGAGSISSAPTTYLDPLADKKSCERDVPLLKELGTNTIRTYAIDPEADHSFCMNLLQEAGIYVIADLGEPALSINREEPQWNTELFGRYQKVIDSLSPYSNVIGYFAGNEVTNAKNNTGASAYVKAAIRDSKKYIKEKHNSRWLGVGYATNDDTDIRTELSNYFNCDSQDDSADFWGYNIYSWCGDSTMQVSGYDKQAEFFSNYSIPVFFAEYGCNDGGGAEARIFTDTEALYSREMASVFSGGIVYMYFQEANDFGLVRVENGEAVKMKNFEVLKKQLAKIDPKGSDSTAEMQLSECPVMSQNWQANKALPTTPDKALCDCMVSSLTCVPKANLDKKQFARIFGFVCGNANRGLCAGISGNTTSGVYGAYSMCEASAKLAFVMDGYYKKQNSGAFACDFGGAAEVQKAIVERKCEGMLKEAKKVNEHAATATAATPKATSTKDSKSATNAASLSILFFILAVSV
ncbi:1,3-beta-glucanosyltransferase gel4 [Beauveria bassiana D1-5]|uniref:1,3-beta-glucanosyltransferase n=1 Tax=Beauveria bassiana D1-5 TaxID=1245745 RepID=A0A0A2V8Y8_BEABA|nr:1,3-beta-glucanosyltransferase gel4 [Beauveria bassiana D1-5]